MCGGIRGSSSSQFSSFNLSFFISSLFCLFCCFLFLFLSFCFYYFPLSFVGCHLGRQLYSCLFFAGLKFCCRLRVVPIFRPQIIW